MKNPFIRERRREERGSWELVPLFLCVCEFAAAAGQLREGKGLCNVKVDQQTDWCR